MRGETPPGKYRELTPEEEEIIVHKGTEPPFYGEYVDFFEEGVYACRRCGAMLYSSDDKFDSNCGWPSFDDEIKNAVKRVLDHDGIRTEILCANCGAHLGHVFEGELLTPKNTRHCVNSVSLLFVPKKDINAGVAYFAGGCFWGVEYYMSELEGVISTAAGYMGGNTASPKYDDVSSGTTGHAETVFVFYDPARINYETLAKRFFEIHDPTQVNRQGPDVGEQYRSVIFYTDEEQKKTAEKLIEELEGTGLYIATLLEPAKKFWKAEEYHQDYFKNREIQPFCNIPVVRWRDENNEKLKRKSLI
ncbi:bifunctional methionine sulfoxide reductase B/A protein [Methanoplanus sp. FWC-SCC4]|uniref:Peptide methionine sulfoxide reductase MsrA n=1 Tax=Methanochimaera problematica TaxID=2609417 RepID=A0AA97FCV1_9EURY|nr:bifunctional methionine sulfoxide reductase B/A protein [Methanoplanus sp. FWC-SCC4]WOF17155.1 bifunctional methionine sulfoxide reductase B/A protein [Methanoplanus sp. FWC-SCC4]